MHLMEVREGDRQEISELCANIHQHYHMAALNIQQESCRIEAQAQHQIQCSQAQLEEKHRALENVTRERERQLKTEAQAYVFQYENTAQNSFHAAEERERQAHRLEAGQMQVQYETLLQQSQQEANQLRALHEFEI